MTAGWTPWASKVAAVTDQEPKSPQWLAARTARSALIMAICYTALCVLVIMFAATGASAWYWLLAVLAALLSVLEWASFAYLRKRGR